MRLTRNPGPSAAKTSPRAQRALRPWRFAVPTHTIVGARDKSITRFDRPRVSEGRESYVIFWWGEGFTWLMMSSAPLVQVKRWARSFQPSM